MTRPDDRDAAVGTTLGGIEEESEQGGFAEGKILPAPQAPEGDEFKHQKDEGCGDQADEGFKDQAGAVGQGESGELIAE